jgi:hypothetical protein
VGGRTARILGRDISSLLSILLHSIHLFHFSLSLSPPYIIVSFSFFLFFSSSFFLFHVLPFSVPLVSPEEANARYIKKDKKLDKHDMDHDTT